MTKQALRQALKSLPKDLDSTYDRILGKIKEEHQDAALRILQWLAYAARPLRLVEIAEVIAVDASEKPSFDAEKRLQNPWDVMAICPDLLTTVILEPLSRWTDEDGDVVEVRFAHLSVKEYLESSRIQKGDAKFYSLREVQANIAIAETCIIYLLQFDQPVLSSREDFKEFPLVDYAAEFWPKHARASEDENRVALPLSLEMLSSNSFALLNSVYICKPDFPYRLISKNDKTMQDLPLYFASFHGLFYSVKSLLERGADVNAKDENFSPALQYAAYKRRYSVTRLLLEKGADVNAVGREYGTALQAACIAIDIKIAQLLLDHGADVNALRGKCGGALLVVLNSFRSERHGSIRSRVQHGDIVRFAQKRRIMHDLGKAFCQELGFHDIALEQGSEDEEDEEDKVSEYDFSEYR